MADQERKSVKRVVLMEFQLAADEVAKALSEEDREAWLTQLGEETPPGGDITILLPVAEAEGGPKQVVDEVARTGARFRAIAKDSYDQGHEAVPPDQQKFELRPL